MKFSAHKQTGHAEQRQRGKRETGWETVSTMGESASTADDLGSVEPDAAPGAEPLVDSSPGTAATAAAAAAAAAGVEVVSATVREGTRYQLKHLFSAESLSEHHARNNANRWIH